jgi:GMP synthase (glutamine-hydrolysing)
MPKEKVIILDFGSQYNQLIARKVREHNVFCEIVPPTIDIRSIDRDETKGIILSGGPARSTLPAPRPAMRAYFL